MHGARIPSAGMESSFLRIRLFNQDCPISTMVSFNTVYLRQSDRQNDVKNRHCDCFAQTLAMTKNINPSVLG
jgi:hypothetical protein